MSMPDWLQPWESIDDPFWRGFMKGWCQANLWGLAPLALLIWLVVKS